MLVGSVVSWGRRVPIRSRSSRWKVGSIAPWEMAWPVNCSNSRASTLDNWTPRVGMPSKMSLRLSSALSSTCDAKRARVRPSSRSEKISIRSGSAMEKRAVQRCGDWVKLQPEAARSVRLILQKSLRTVGRA